MLNFKIKQKMTSGLIIPLILMSCICFLAVNMMGKIESGVVSIYNDRVVPLEELKIIGDDYAVYVVDAINKANAGAYTAEEASKVLRDANQSISQKWQAFLTTKLTDEETQLSREASKLFATADLSIIHIIQKLDGLDGTIIGQLSNDILPLYAVIDPVSSKISELVSLQLRVASEEKSKVSEIYSSSVTLFIALNVIAIFTSILIGLWLTRSIMLPIDDIVNKLSIIQNESDLTVKFKTFNDDELGQISSNLTLVINHLREILESIFHASNTVGDSTVKLREFTIKNSERIYEQQSETEQTATAMNQMVATVAEVAQNTTVAADSAKDADSSAANGDRIVQESIMSMSFLSEQIEQAAKVIAQLSDESRNIGSMLDVIKGIAEQTNLLALNAAIEAARAGEQGRGFAVVADEVRTLAQRTQKSTQEIETMIERLQKGVKQAVISMEMGIKQVNDANDKANMAGDALNKIVESVDNINNMNTQIATAAEEQSCVAESINRSIITISDIALASTEASHELSSSVEELSSLSENMRSQVGQFKL
ncbi:MAG: methyl-accepting chemotaxis protein [Shewanella sp.]|jgi:methyl-accepting chemotaxis protein